MYALNGDFDRLKFAVGRRMIWEMLIWLDSILLVDHWNVVTEA